MRRGIRLTLVLALLGGAGCGEKKAFESEPTVPLDTVPAIVKEAAAKELPGVHFEQVWKVKGDGGEDAFELRGKNETGKTREVRVSTAGKVLEVE